MGATNPSAAKLSQFKTASTTFAVPSNASSTNPNAASVTSNAGGTKSSTQDSTGSPVRATQNSSDPAQHTQTDASQAANAAGKPADSTAAQTISFGSVVTSHESAQSHTASGTAADAPRTDTESAHVAAEASNVAGPAGSSSINSARVIQSMNETEMRVGMHSTEFGDISIRTMVTQQQLQAQISVDHSELGSALSAHIPSMQAKFGNELGLHATIEVSQSGTSFSGDRGQSSPREQRPFVQSIQADGTQAPAETDRVPLRAPPSVLDESRLDIRA
jgi:flagellar hook-length control protein FliK